MLKDFSVEKIFVFLSIVFGLLYVILLPPFQSVDEASHFFRGFEIANAKFISSKIENQTGRYLPQSLSLLSSKFNYLIKDIDKKTSPKFILDTASINLDKEKTSFTNFQNTALYSPICYLGQSTMMFIAQKINLAPIWIFYAGRIGNLFLFTVLIFFAIKITPVYKVPFALLALMPMTLSLAASLTSDVMLIGLNFLWVAFLLKIIFVKAKIKKSDIIFLVIMASLIALCKHYIMLIPLVFLIPKEKFSAERNYYVSIFTVLSSAILCLALWQYFINDFSPSMSPNADYHAQLNFILTHPLHYIVIFIKSLFVKLPRILITMIGVLGWQDTPLDFLTYILYPILMVLALGLDNENLYSLKIWQKVLLAIILLIAIITIFTNMYLMWSSVGAPIILGLNGKYFIPLMPAFLLLFLGKVNFSKKNKHQLLYLILILLILILISGDLSIVHRFYEMTPNLYYKI